MRNMGNTIGDFHLLLTDLLQRTPHLQDLEGFLQATEHKALVQSNAEGVTCSGKQHVQLRHGEAYLGIRFQLAEGNSNIHGKVEVEFTYTPTPKK